MRTPAVFLGLLLIGPAWLTGGAVAGAAAPEAEAAPQISAIRFGPQPLRAGTTGAFRFVTTRGGAVRITLARQVVGRRAGARCAPVTKAPRGAKPCLLAIPAGTLHSSVDAGEGLRRFDGTVAGRRLPAGRYRATLRVTSAAAGTSAPAYVTVRIAAAPR